MSEHCTITFGHKMKRFIRLTAIQLFAWGLLVTGHLSVKHL